MTQGSHREIEEEVLLKVEFRLLMLVVANLRASSRKTFAAHVMIGYVII